MRIWYQRGLAGAACLALLACAERADTVNPAETLTQLRAGRAQIGRAHV